MSEVSVEDFKNLPEALEMSEPISRYDEPIFAAARAFSRLLAVCDTCGGTGNTFDRSKAHVGHTGPYVTCPSCVGGVVVSPEAVERAAEAVFVAKRDNYPVSFWSGAEVERFRARNVAVAVLRAAVGLLGP